jgi:hypothetical protein
MKKLFITIADVAAAEYFPRETPSFGVLYPSYINVFLKAGGVLTISEAENGGAVFQKWYDDLFLPQD